MIAARRIGPRSDRHRLPGTPIEKIRFAGGLSLALWPDRRRSYAALRCYVRGGSIAEPVGGSGVAHLLEHLIAGRAAEGMWRCGDGALLRAFTTRDHTCYAWSALEEDAAPSLARFLAALEDGKSLAARLAVERAVVSEEIQLLARDPVHLLHQGFVEAAFDAHPIRHPICGRERQVRQAGAAGLRRYLRAVYNGPNLHLVAVGGFAAGEIVAAAEAADARLPAGERFRVGAGRAEPARAEPCRFAIEAPEPCLSCTLIGFRTLEAEDEEASALHALAAAVRHGRSGLERGMAGIAGCRATAFSAHTPFSAGWFAVRVEHPPGYGAEVEERVLAWLDRLRRGEVEELPPPAAEDADLPLEGVAWKRPEDLDGTAALLGEGDVSAGDPLAALRFQLAAGQADAAAIARAVARHGIDGNLAIGRLVSRGADRTESGAAAARRWTGPRLAAKPSWEVRAGRLPNGMALLVLPTPGALASCQVMARGGVLLDGRRTSGLAHLTAVLLAAGEGPGVYPFCDESFSGVSLTCAGTELLAGLPRLAATALRPQFSAADFTAWRGRIVDQLEGRGRADWSEEARLRLKRRLYRLHSYGRPEIGTLRSLAALTLSQVRECHASCFLGGNMAVVVAGEVDAAAAYAGLEELFGDVPGATGGPLDFLQAPESRRPGPARHVERGPAWPAGLSLLALGYSGIAWEPRTWAALELARTLLAGPESRALGGRLIRALRAAGCSYAVQCLNQAGIGEGYFAVLAAVAPAEAERVIGIVSDELDRLRKGEVDPEELATCRKLLRLDRLMLGEAPRSLAYFAGRQALYSGDPAAWLTLEEQLAAIRIEDLADVAGRCLAPASETLVLTRPAAPREERS